MKDNKLTLTPNRRLAAFLVRQHNKQQATGHKKTWETPQIYPLEAWLNQLWLVCLENSSQPLKPVLKPLQQQILWEQIIQNSSVGVELLRISATAKNALQAWKFLRQWQVRIDKLAAYAQYSPDTAAFYSWLQEYLTWLDANNYSDFNLMLDQIIEQLPGLTHRLPNEICLMGVDDIVPQYQRLFSVLAEHGIAIRREQIVQPGAELGSSGLPNINLELQAAANWAVNKLTSDPENIIGIVVPQLEIMRQKVVRTFSTVIPPQLINISAPSSLSSYALIDTALLILQLAKPLVNYNDFSILLRSPYIADSETEIHSRALLDRQLRDKLEAKNNWAVLNKRIAGSQTSIETLINDFTQGFTELHGKHSPEYWVQKIQSLLACWGWPGDRGLTIEEGHLLSCWQDLLHDYCQLAIVIPEHNYSQALQYIQRLASETPFLPAETGLTRVHVLGVLEAAGIYFDYLWVTGMDRNSWPPDAAPNPFIPLELQRQVDMPRSSPQRELKVAQRLTATLKQGAKHEVVFSYSQRVEDRVNQPSNLIVNLPVLNIPDIKITEQHTANTTLEKIIDQQAAQLTINEIKGGVAILKAQAQCQFKAYAEHRLQAKSLTEPKLILDAAARGNIVHAVMEDFWRQCKTQDKLISLLPNDLLQILTIIIDQVLNRYQRKAPNTLTANYMLLEKNRLLTLVTRWLEYEKTREPFSVQQIEQKILVSVGPLTLNLRVDRVDELSDGSVLIIDYKTGLVNLKSWYEDRIIEPQLPLYTLQFAAHMVSVAIADMRVDKLVLKGVKENENWSVLVANWQAILKQTAVDFAQGLAKVDPYSTQICRNCNLQSLCRIYDF